MTTIEKIRMLQRRRGFIQGEAQDAWKEYSAAIDDLAGRDVIEELWKTCCELEDNAHAIWIEIEELYKLANAAPSLEVLAASSEMDEIERDWKAQVTELRGG